MSTFKSAERKRGKSFKFSTSMMVIEEGTQRKWLVTWFSMYTWGCCIARIIMLSGIVNNQLKKKKKKKLLKKQKHFSVISECSSNESWKTNIIFANLRSPDYAIDIDFRKTSNIMQIPVCPGRLFVKYAVKNLFFQNILE